MAFKKYNIKKPGNPNPENANQTSNPRTPQEKVQAIADLLETRLKADLTQSYAERALMISDMAYALGTDGRNVEDYIKQMEKDFSGIATKSKQTQKVDKKSSPELKKVSTDKSVLVDVPGAKNTNTKRAKK